MTFDNLPERNRQMVADLQGLADSWKLVADETPGEEPAKKPKRASKPRAKKTKS